MSRMIRSTCFFVLLLSCCVANAQNPAPAPAQDPPGAATPSGASTPSVVGVTTTQGAEITQFQKIEDNWSNAINQRDQYALENVLSPLFLDVAANGDITTRNQQIVQAITSADKSLSLTQQVIAVRMLGDIAVANGTYTLHHRVNSAQVDEKGVFTHVFERLRGGWVCINSQRTALKQDNTNSKKKQSQPSETFHFPLFSKGDKAPQQ